MSNRSSLGVGLITLLAHHANGSFPDFQAIFAIVFHRSILSNDGVSGKAGAVQVFHRVRLV